LHIALRVLIVNGYYIIFIILVAKHTPAEMGRHQVEAFLSNQISQGKVAASTQRQALNALVFLYREVLDTPIKGEIAPIQSKKKVHPPTVLTPKEVQTMLLK
jgi:hypothetical protein